MGNLCIYNVFHLQFHQLQLIKIAAHLSTTHQDPSCYIRTSSSPAQTDTNTVRVNLTLEVLIQLWGFCWVQAMIAHCSTLAVD